MLSVNSYPKEYVDACRARVDSQVSTYRALVRAAAPQTKTRGSKLGSALDNLEPVFFNNMVIVLDSFFTHRARGMEGKDGNPLNEVRVLCTSLLQHDGRLVAEKGIKMNASKSVLGYEVGEEIRVAEPDFVRLAKAYFAEIESKYSST